MTNIKELITDYRTDRLNGLFIDSKEITESSYQIISVYNNNKGLLQKYWLLSPKLRIFRDTIPLNVKFKKAMPLSLLIHPITDEIKRFKLFIKRLERKIAKEINIKTKNVYSIKKIYDDFPEILNVKMPFNKYENDMFEFEFHIYRNRRRVNIDKLTNNTNVSIFIELSDVWICNGKMGFNWNVKQMKVFPVYDFTQYMFSDSEDEEDYHTEEVTECYHCMYCPNKHVRTSFYQPVRKIVQSSPVLPPSPIISIPKYSPEKHSITPSFVPSLQDLLNIKLKPVKNIMPEKEDKPNILNNMKEAKRNLLDLEPDKDPHLNE